MNFTAPLRHRGQVSAYFRRRRWRQQQRRRRRSVQGQDGRLQGDAILQAAAAKKAQSGAGHIFKLVSQGQYLKRHLLSKLQKNGKYKIAKPIYRTNQVDQFMLQQTVWIQFLSVISKNPWSSGKSGSRSSQVTQVWSQFSPNVLFAANLRLFCVSEPRHKFHSP